VTTTAAADTGLALITVDATGQNSITVISGANHAWDDGIPPLQLTPSDMVVCQLEIPLPMVSAAFTQARAARATTILNPAPYLELPRDILSSTDILILNEIELAQMLGRSVGNGTDQSLTTAVRTLLERGPSAAIVTLGAAGALLVESSGQAHRLAGLSVTAVDTTGAGDCFVGALVAELQRDGDLLAATHFANAAAALSVTKNGAASAMPTRSDLTRFLQLNDDHFCCTAAQTLLS
jgi:ribokinase